MRNLMKTMRLWQTWPAFKVPLLATKETEPKKKPDLRSSFQLCLGEPSASKRIYVTLKYAPTTRHDYQLRSFKLKVIANIFKRKLFYEI
jgi:hypothetical protein